MVYGSNDSETYKYSPSMTDGIAIPLDVDHASIKCFCGSLSHVIQIADSNSTRQNTGGKSGPARHNSHHPTRYNGKFGCAFGGGGLLAKVAIATFLAIRQACITL